MRRPVLHTLGGFICGLLAVHVLGLSPVAAYLLLLSCFLLYMAVVLISRARGVRDPALLTLYVAACTLNCAVRCQPVRALPEVLREADEVLVFGAVLGESRDTYGRMQSLVFTDSFHLGDCCYRLRQRMLVVAPSVSPPPAVGESWSFAGTIAEIRGLRNPGGFDRRAYYGRSGVRYRFECTQAGRREAEQNARLSLLFSRAASRARGRIRDVFNIHIRGEEAALLCALLLGERSGVDPTTLQVFTEAGVMHILAVSGLHVGIIWFALLVPLRVLRVPRKLLLAVSTVAMAGYCMLVGHRPPVIRATIMLGAFSLTSLMERELDSVNILCVAALAILLLNPHSLFEAGFQLSFMCTASIIRLLELTSPMLSRTPPGRRAPILRWLVGSAVVSVSAQMGSAPLVMFHFNRVAAAPVLANLLVVPLAAIDLCLGMLVAVLGLARMPLAGLAAAANWLFLRLTLLSARFFSALPFSSFRVTRPQLIWICLWYALLLLLPCIRVTRRTRFLVLLLVLAALDCWVWDSALSTTRPPLSAAFLDVGQGDCVVLETGSGRTLLLDAGPAFGLTDSGERVLGPFLWGRGVREIDVLVLTHTHNDHIGGMKFVLENFKVGTVLDTGIPFPSKTYLDFLKEIRRRGIGYRVVRKGMSYLFEGWSLHVLHPDGRTAQLATALPGFDPNDVSVVLGVAYREADLLLTGDIDKRAGAAVRSVEKVDVLKAPHHGSENPSRILLEMGLLPSAVVFSAGFGNRFSLPSQKAVSAYQARGSRIYRTDRDGCILFTTDGYEWDVETVSRLRRMRPIERFLTRYGWRREGLRR